MTKNQQIALDIVRREIGERGRGSVTASLVATQAGEPFEVRKWSGVLVSLSHENGPLRGIPDGMLNKSFYVIREDS
jgi:hypothetical protein